MYGIIDFYKAAQKRGLNRLSVVRYTLRHGQGMTKHTVLTVSGNHLTLYAKIILATKISLQWFRKPGQQVSTRNHVLTVT